MNTNAMPVSPGSRLSIWVNASMPPAEAPIPTIGNVIAGASRGSSPARGFVFAFFRPGGGDVLSGDAAPVSPPRPASSPGSLALVLVDFFLRFAINSPKPVRLRAPPGCV